MYQSRHYIDHQTHFSMQEASGLFEISWKKLKNMDAKTFTRLYRKQALKLHPDQGGSQFGLFTKTLYLILFTFIYECKLGILTANHKS